MGPVYRIQIAARYLKWKNRYMGPNKRNPPYIDETYMRYADILIATYRKPTLALRNSILRYTNGGVGW